MLVMLLMIKCTRSIVCGVGGGGCECGRSTWPPGAATRTPGESPGSPAARPTPPPTPHPLPHLVLRHGEGHVLCGALQRLGVDGGEQHVGVGGRDGHGSGEPRRVALPRLWRREGGSARKAPRPAAAPSPPPPSAAALALSAACALAAAAVGRYGGQRRVDGGGQLRLRLAQPRHPAAGARSTGATAPGRPQTGAARVTPKRNILEPGPERSASSM